MSNGRLTVMIDGREALPIRAIPYVTAWKEPPDSIVSALAEPATIDCGKGLRPPNRYALCAYQMFDQGHYEPISASQWKDRVITLNSLTRRLRADERDGATDENHGPWRIHAILSLRDDVFVWLDEFRAWYSITRPMVTRGGDDDDRRRMAEWQAAQESSDPDMQTLDELESELFPNADVSLCLTAMLPPEIEGQVWRYAVAEEATVAGEPADPCSMAANQRDVGVSGKAAVTTHRLSSGRRNILDSVIERARKQSIAPDDPSAVWAVLVHMANSSTQPPPPPLLGYVDDEGSVKYQSSTGVKFLTLRNLRERMARVKQRAKPR